MQTKNIILSTDSYKVSHARQYPAGTEYVYSYLESRGGKWTETLFFGLQYFIKEYLEGQVVTQAKIDEAEEFFAAHFGNNTLFNKEGWQYILDHHNGQLPVSIKAVPEGTIVPTGNVMVTVENTDPKCYWLTNYLETLLVQVWYPITVATQSHEMKKIIKQYLDETANSEGLLFKLHDFGYRGVSSCESAGIGGLAHLVNFMGTDTIEALVYGRKYYHENMAGFSIPASEHSTITSWGKDKELDAMRNMLEAYPTGLVACVSDSFDIYKACKDYWGGELKDQIMGRDGTLVVRPDSGEPSEVVVKCLNILGQQFGVHYNKQGYKELPPQIRMIQGDGIDYENLTKILEAIKQAGWSTDMLAFGCGGALLQKLNRDTQKFAFKCSSITVNGKEQDVYKQPVDAAWKASKKGRFALIQQEGKLTTVQGPHEEDIMREVFRNGKLLVDDKLADIRQRATQSRQEAAIAA